MKSSVTLDLDGVPLKTSLRLITEQLGMMYEIKEGLMEFGSTGCRDYPYREDPRLAAEQFVLALLSAGVGALLAPLVVRPPGDPAETARGE